ncbi:TetR/AcrR family transcriptional regulator [Paenibacillus donghaensis]|uniref:TetR family transcriptional regulator n=1 Tax=Paenibacillus donghaensis TaxID=414771 RepID=A0A2Z2KRL7_9BACL|nr:TetR/AcrR family transcriptional regulator [Paenibacillus donghaensis]ASA21638.1 TetR family transcriptional regulator [Paenibacillus donghaensis]
MARRRLPADESKAFILSNAHTLFIKKGYKGTTMDDLCELTQLSKGNIYHHFRNKEDIFLQLLETYVGRLSLRWLSTEYQSLSPSEQLIALADQFGRECENPLLTVAEEYFKMLTDDSSALSKVSESVELIPNAIKEAVKRGIDQQSFKGTDTESLSFAVLSMLVGATQLCLAMPDLSSDEYASVHVNAIQLLLSGISTE